MENSFNPLCVRTLTPKGDEQFEITRDGFEISLHGLETYL